MQYRYQQLNGKRKTGQQKILPQGKRKVRKEDTYLMKMAKITSQIENVKGGQTVEYKDQTDFR